jgi:hypothetical protein
MKPLAALFILCCPALALADATPHAGLLSNLEMAQVLHNAQATQKLLFPEQQISACWPYDEMAKKPPLSGKAYCKVETPHMLNSALQIQRGPDMFCSYLREEFCDVKPADTSR